MTFWNRQCARQEERPRQQRVLVPIRFALLVVNGVFLGSATAQGINGPVPLINGTQNGKLLYGFTGAVSFDGPDRVVTSVSCTNTDKPGKPAALVAVEFFDRGGNPVNDITAGEGVVAIPVGGTRTVSTHGTAVFFEDEFVSLDFTEGSGRIISTSTRVVCTARVVDGLATTPASALTLPMFRKLKQGGQ
jgi:hypothetical protein